jgi:SNF2 family DNA or RNA helicase
MLVLHGAWIPNPRGQASRFALWGEASRGPGRRPSANARAAAGRGEPRAQAARARRHPFGARLEQLLDARVPESAERAGVAAGPAEVLVRLPSAAARPLPSPQLPVDVEAGPAEVPALAAWRVDALAFAPAAAAAQLAALAGELHRPDIALGEDLRFWVLASRFALALLYRQWLMPTIRKRGDAYVARWRPLLDEPADRQRFEALAAAMPAACRALAESVDDPEPRPRELLRDYLDAVVDDVARVALAEHEREAEHPGVRGAPRRRRAASEAWLEALSDEPIVQGKADELATFYGQYRGWADLAGAAGDGAEPFRLCLRLDPPPPSVDDQGVVVPRPGERNWALEYLLQATDDPSLLVPAADVWRQRGSTARLLSRRLDQPQERLLTWLGRASRVYPPIDASLRAATPEVARLTAGEAHEFVRERALVLRANGFGVLVPGLDSRVGIHLHLGRTRSAPGKTSGPATFSQERLVAFDWQLALGDERLSRQEFAALARLKEPLVQVRGRWVELRPDQIQHALAFFKSHDQGSQMSLAEALGLALAPDGETGLPVVEVSSEGWIDELLRSLRQGERRAELGEPPGFVGALRPYQRIGVSWLTTLRRYGLGACLADDMGLGKTIQVIALLLHQRQGSAAPEASTNGDAARRRRRAAARAEPAAAARAGATTKRVSRPGAREAAATASATGPNPTSGPALLVCPTSVVGNWQRELARFAPALRVLVHHGAERDVAQLAALAARHDVVLSTYALLHRDEAALAAVEWNEVILDEAQNIKNAATRAAQAARKLPAQWRAALTGTPVENRLADLWSIFEFLNPGYLGSAAAFRRRFAAPIERGADPDATARLKALVGPFILRRVKTDRAIIQDLPAKNEMKVYCTLTREQATLYEAVVRSSLDQIEESESIQRRGQILATLTKLKQLCNHPALFLHDGSALVGRSGKLARLTEMLEEVMSVGDRALVFTQYAEMGKLLKEHLEATFGREVLFLHGGTPAAARDRLVAQFQSDAGGAQAFVLSLKAGGTGLNLTRANHVFHFDRWWNPAVENQATDRAFRIGQRRDVQVHKYLCAGTFEEAIDELIERKVSIASSITGTSEAWITELKTDELRELFALRREAVGVD